MSTNETKPDPISLHHHTNRQNVAATDDGDDFMAAFNGDDNPASTPAPVDNDTPDPGALDPAPPADDENNLQRGVDSPENGEQVPPQPTSIALDELPETTRQQVEAILAERQRLTEEAAQSRRDFAALHSRVAPVQRELDIAKRELAQVRQPAAPQQQPQPAQPAVHSAVAALEAQFTSPKWQEYERLYPEDAAIHKDNQLALARVTDEQSNRLEYAIRDQFQRVGRIEQDRQEVFKRDEIRALEQAHPDWQQLNESAEFWDWFETKEVLFGFQNEGDKRNRMQNRNFVSTLLDMYKSEGARGEQQAGSNSAPVQQATQPQSADAVVALAASPRNTGGGIRRPAGAGSPGNDFLAGYQDQN